MAPAVDRYDLVARLFHWLIVGLLVVQFAIAWTMPEIERGSRPVGLVGWHVSIGLTIVFVAVARVAWRATHRPPSPPRDLPVILQRLSRVTHYLLYALLIVLPLAGWANASARGWPIIFYSSFALPPLTATGSATGMALGDIHKLLATALLVTIGLHIGGALYHALVLRDRTLQRIL